jgi:thymidylate kinase
MPTLTVILSLSYKTQVERMTQRGLTTGDKNMLNRQQELSIAYFRNALEFGIPFIVIDTGVFKPETCSEIVIEAIKSL